MTKCLILAAATALAMSGAAAAHAEELLQNGDFESGLTGWTSYTTANGTISPTTPNQGGVPFQEQFAEISSFAAQASGSNALHLNAGQAYAPYGASNPQGGGVKQSFVTTLDGLVSFSADIAAWTRQPTDQGGIFSVLLDDVEVATIDLGTIVGVGSTLSTIGFTDFALAAGQHEIALQVVRSFGPAAGVRAQYWDNASLDFTATAGAVPEPATWAMMIMGFGLIGAAMRRRAPVARLA